MGKMARNKGRRGETTCKALLGEYDYTVLADTSAGVSQCDLIAQDMMGTVYAVECKNTASINVRAYRDQAKQQAGKMRWMLLCKIDGTSSWLVLKQGSKATVWHERVKDGDISAE